MSSPLPNNVRVTTRVPVSVKETLQKAADLTGATLNQFLISAAVKEAQAVIKQQQVIRLSSSDADKIFSFIDIK
ncbi:YlcI/YnfO family protein [Crocosphaera sp. UHCC 0190]|uniref:type II toxin-antitoxin system TacA family antitoxin n=1 Tax=Crocosphaera sp. UHCC 0190 TaxID=3110246 RepID=UPI002B20DCA2|nr:YlcI/YnfO family protein [Crocosphaera sp. UHCC 0190]MEA5511902.1 YlcI/YnfO family protein [Crocosphaera sp. UHCC 0190]